MGELDARQVARVRRYRDDIETAAERARSRFAGEVRRLEELGHSRGAIGRALGITRQAVHDLVRRAEAADPPPVARAARRASA